MDVVPLSAPEWFAPLRAGFEKHRSLARSAAAQVHGAAFFAPLGPVENGEADRETNSIAHLFQHVGGNLRSRFTDFLTSDGEKPDRHRDAEFEDGRSRADIEAVWADGWAALFDTLDALTPDDLARTVTIRGEPLSVPEALVRAFAHVSYHVGQIVLLAKHHAGPSWRTLSIPRGGSAASAPAVRARTAFPPKTA